MSRDPARLLDALLDGELADDELPYLEAALQRDATLRRRFWRESRLRRELAGAWVRDETFLRWRRPALLLAAPVLLLGLGLGLWLALHPDAAPDDTRIACPDGSHLRLEPGTVLHRQDADAGLAYRLERGIVHAQVVPRGGRGPFVVVANHFQAEVLGTRFTLRTDAEATMLQVEEGLVRWRRPAHGQSGVLHANQEHVVFSSSAAAALPAMAVGMEDVGHDVAWRPLDLAAPGAWRWYEAPRAEGYAAELFVELAEPRPAVCLAVAYPEATAQRLRVWLEGVATYDTLPATGLFDAAACRERVTPVLRREAGAQPLTVILVAYRHLGDRHSWSWYEVQVAVPGRAVQRFLAVDGLGRCWPGGLRLAGAQRAGLLPVAAAWRPLDREP